VCHKFVLHTDDNKKNSHWGPCVVRGLEPLTGVRTMAAGRGRGAGGGEAMVSRPTRKPGHPSRGFFGRNDGATSPRQHQKTKAAPKAQNSAKSPKQHQKSKAALVLVHKLMDRVEEVKEEEGTLSVF